MLHSVQSHAQAPKSSLVFILDGSGSMWGRIKGNEPKIVAAKKVMSELLKEVPANVEIGFVAYGHRRKGDCSDIETLAELGAEPGAVDSKVQAINPRGKTPITEALRHGATLLKGSDRASTMVLVSDGIETCGGDPCALARELKAQSVKLVIHTVGFGVGSEAADQLRCIATAADGNYYDVQDGAALRDALFAVRQAVIEQKASPLPAAATAEPLKSQSKAIKLSGPGTIKLKPAGWVKAPPYRWHAVDAESGERKASAQERTELKVPAGEYQIVWRQEQHGSSDIALTATVNVPAGKTVEVPIDTGIEIVVPEGMGAPYDWALTEPGAQQPFARFRELLEPQVVPAGTYLLGWRQIQHDAPWIDLGPVTLEAGKLNRFVIDSGFQVVAADWVPPEPYALSLQTADGKTLGPWHKLDVPLIAPPGTYSVVYRQSQHNHSPIRLGEVTVPAHGFAEVLVNSGVRFKPQPGAEPPYQAIFVPLGSEGEPYIWYGKNAGQWEPVPLPPGRYRLDWKEDQHNSERMTLLEEFSIEPGSLVEFEM
jgi:Mg-chelatase subunit ChlD